MMATANTMATMVTTKTSTARHTTIRMTINTASTEAKDITMSRELSPP